MGTQFLDESNVDNVSVQLLALRLALSRFLPWCLFNLGVPSKTLVFICVYDFLCTTVMVLCALGLSCLQLYF